MAAHRALHGTALTAAACVGLTSLTSCAVQPAQSSTLSDDGTFSSPSQELGDGSVATYVVLDDGAPTEVGVRMTPTALEGLPEQGVTLMVDFPDEAADTAFDHVMLNWNPQGHEPFVLFGRPHFDYHFNMVDMATIEAITPTDPQYAAKAEHFPEPQYVPQDYVLPPAGPAALQAVPGMGVHLVDSTDTSLVPGQYDFTQIIINGVWDGRYTFVEPMITRDWLLTGPDLEAPLKLPEAYQETAYYPTSYSISVDEETDDYVVSLTSLTSRTAS
ncbi:DUF5602 domain-containing protein [Geodermatophilus sp. SYSU D00965]